MQQTNISLERYTHRSFDVYQIFPALASGFRGSVRIATPLGGVNFVALILSGDLGVLSSYPAEALNWPVSQSERIYKIWQKVLNTALPLALGSGYDPYSGTGALGRLYTVSTLESTPGHPLGLLAPDFDGINDPHGSLTQRLTVIIGTLALACQQPGVQSMCTSYRQEIHPHFPGSAPMSEEPRPRFEPPSVNQ